MILIKTLIPLIAAQKYTGTGCNDAAEILQSPAAPPEIPIIAIIPKIPIISVIPIISFISLNAAQKYARTGCTNAVEGALQ